MQLLIYLNSLERNHFKWNGLRRGLIRYSIALLCLIAFCQCDDGFKQEEFVEVFIPQLFTPNGDGQNDVFRIRLKNGLLVTGINLRILDWRGATVYKTSSILEATEIGWDGGEYPSETYFWHLDIAPSSIQHEKSGRIILVRYEIEE